MSTHLLSHAARLSDRELVARVKRLAHEERSAIAALVAHLAVLDERRLYLAEGFASLFIYCTRVLHLSEHATYNRIEAARAARRFPAIIDRLVAGDIHLTAIRLLAPHLTGENHTALLDEARHLTAREVEEIVARLQPRPPVPSTIRRLPAPRQAAAPTSHVRAHMDRGPSEDPAAQADGAASPSPSLTLAAFSGQSSSSHPLSLARRAVVEPLAPGQFRVQFTADEETRDKLRRAQELLRHRIPDGDLGKVIDLALTALLKDLATQKHAATDRPRAPTGVGNGAEAEGGAGRRNQARSRHIPAAVKRAVWVRDGGQCAFVAADGRRCPERGLLEFHHLEPYAAGGAATIDNIQLRCRSHNGFEAERYFVSRFPGVREPIEVPSCVPLGWPQRGLQPNASRFETSCASASGDCPPRLNGGWAAT